MQDNINGVVMKRNKISPWCFAIRLVLNREPLVEKNSKELKVLSA